MNFKLTRWMLCFFLMSSSSVYAQRVTCPQGLKWVFDGYCKKEFDSIRDGTCPQRSKLHRISVTSDLICRAEGQCPDGTVANASGICQEPEVKKTYRKL